VLSLKKKKGILATSAACQVCVCVCVCVQFCTYSIYLMALDIDAAVGSHQSIFFPYS
jgi:hypothetical protein